MVETEARVVTPIEDWAQVDWQKLERYVHRLQTRIYKAQSRGNVEAVHNLQRLLMKSWAARMLAVRRVTQDNQGKKTAGIDGIKSVKPKERLAMAHALRQHRHIKARPVRRVMIPKRDKKAARPLGIPVMLDRAHQALVKSALEPQWEARFEANSYGFRPGRSCWDAIDAIHEMICRKPKYVLDADIKGCFDDIAHAPLLEKLDATPTIRHAVKAWLRAGVMEGLVLEPTERGTPQGGVISPLLANIALHGLEDRIKRSYTKRIYYEPTARSTCGAKSNMPFHPTLVRYADDFVVLNIDLEGIQVAQTATEEFLGEMGLRLNTEKTRITHTLQAHEGNVGFDFLGFHIRSYPTGEHRARVDRWGNRNHFRTFIKPSKDAIRRHTHEIGTTIREMRGSNQDALIRKLNPIITGWSRYYRTTSSKETFSLCDHIMHQQLWGWAGWRHKDRGSQWRIRRYWTGTPPFTWTFQLKDRGMTLTRHAQTAIRRHVKVKDTASPFDGNLVYWSQRLTNHPLNRIAVAKLLKRQHGKCRECGLLFVDADLLEVDHIDPKGGEAITNKQLLHRHCHDTKTARNHEYKPEGYQCQ